MKKVYIIALVLALLVAPPLSYGAASDGKDDQIAPTCSSDEATNGKDNRKVTLTLLPISDDKLRMQFWEELVRLAQPEMLEVPAKRTIMEAVQARCGSAPKELLYQFLPKLNPGLNPGIADEARELTFIPCPFWAFDDKGHPLTKIPIRKGQSLDNILALYMGIAGPINKDKVKELNPRLLDDNGRAKADGTIRMPYVMAPMEFRLREEIKDNSEEVTRQLTARFSNQMPGEVADRNNAGAGQSYRFVAQDKVSNTDCTPAISKSLWPFDMAQVEARYKETRQQIENERQELRRRGKDARIPPLITPTVVVADTGVDLSNPVSNRNLWTNTSDDIKLSYGKNDHGANLTNSSLGIGVSPNYPDGCGYHGTEVVGIMAGGLSARENLLDKFDIAVAKIIPDREPYNNDIPAGAISAAFAYARAINAKVLSLSVTIGCPSPELVNGLRAADFLVVSAAGNNKELAQMACVYPPGLTENRDRLIVVGAHDWEPKRADFSNYGEDLVDLLAPGCKIPFPGKDGGIEPLSGTSFAAPFVAFTAALLGSFQMSPKEIKSRILATVDYDENLVHDAGSAGRLNIENALSIKDDILVIREASGQAVPYLGVLEGRQSWKCIMSSGKKRDFFPNQVGRVVTNYPVRHDGPRVVMIWERPPDAGKLLKTSCDSLEGVVVFKRKGESVYASYDWNEVVSISPKVPKIR